MLLTMLISVEKVNEYYEARTLIEYLKTPPKITLAMCLFYANKTMIYARTLAGNILDKSMNSSIAKINVCHII